ncbi:RING-H2 finger protein ATL5 [Symbiodinium microadriaticum]|uniref:RING-H2 finger protein ATL5 n=1 Tax=Symbiodinium microadriaticum TaxID=2951 RepID=A0A1Q9EM92_SYMMI|nr:RING-H2 finger protein ATL5 [Symbiodinium microadriaticum]
MITGPVLLEKRMISKYNLRCGKVAADGWQRTRSLDLSLLVGWAALCFGGLGKASPDFRLMRIREGCAHPVKRAKASVIPASLKPQETCLCCLEEFEESDTVALLPCGHVFHEACITEWFLSARSSGACPICRQHLNIV